MLSSGVSLDDRYRLDDRVATGGMGDVWRATDLLLGRTVAVKVLLPTLSKDEAFSARFLAESRMLAAVRHPGVVQVYDRGECDLPDGSRATYLVMEYVEGEPLSERISREGRLPAGVTMAVVAQAARALDAVHAGGIVHRDVKPSNLLIRPDGTVLLVDFGVARSTELTSLTGTNGVLGTALYMAPEQASQRPVTGATDVYALGAVAYHALAGHPPFVGDNPLTIAMMHVEAEPPELPADVPPAARAVVARAMAKDPAARYPTALAMAEAADAAAAGTVIATTAELPPMLAPYSGPPADGVPPTGRRRRVVAVAGAVAGASVLAVVAALMLAANDNSPPGDDTTSTPAPATSAATQPTQRQRTGAATTRPANTPTAGPTATAEPSPSAEESEPATPPPPTSAAPEPSGSEPAADGSASPAASQGAGG